MVSAYVANVAAGVLLCNCLPHLCSGVRGESFPTPFAKPPGTGLSSAFTNTLWGTLNLMVGCWFFHRAPFEWTLSTSSILFFAGFLATGLLLSTHFAKVRRNAADRQP